MQKKSVGLALGGGGARGCAHIGVIKALEEAGIEISYIAGTSIGALVGGVYASGKLQSLEDFVLGMDVKKVLFNLDPAISNQGILKGEKVKKLLTERFAAELIENTQIPFTAVAVELETGKEVHLQSGNLVEAIRASISIPGIFVPVKVGDVYLVDGGLLNPMPVDVVREMGSEVVVAVDLNNSIRNLPEKRSKPNMIDVLGNTITVMQKKITDGNIKSDSPDFLLQPDLANIQLFDFQLAESMIDEGYKVTQAIIPQLQELLS